MAKGIKKKKQQAQVQEGESQQTQEIVEVLSSAPGRPIFTAKQRQILADAYQLILSWPPKRTISSRNCEANGLAGIQTVPVVVEG